jgi:hypothetical protein
VSFASACSGHGFKFASVVGEIMADLAERGTTRHDIELFRLDRLLGRREPAGPRPARRLAPARAPGARPLPQPDRSGRDRRGQSGRPAADHRGGDDRRAPTVSDRSADAIDTFW